MIPIRMMTEKEKSGLIGRLLGLRDVIEKNEVGSDSLPEIAEHIEAI